MAPIARRTWAQIQVEVTRRLKGLDSPDFAARIQYFIWQAYLTLCTTLHHFEFDQIYQPTVSTVTNLVALPGTANYIVINAEIYAPGTGVYLGTLLFRDPRTLFSLYDGKTGLPTHYTRFGNNLYLSRLPDALYTLNVYTYDLPAAPDFSATTGPSAFPATNVDCDLPLIDLTLAFANNAISRPDLAVSAREAFSTWLQAQPRPFLAPTPIGDRKEEPRTGESLGGAQG
jgi:hypothetical protein